jgi:thiamine-phosphate pyrophosphorylase
MNVTSHKLPRLHIVSSGREHLDMPGRALCQAAAIARSGPVIFQLREKGLAASSLYDIACRLRGVLDTSKSLLMVNERADIAQASGADGIHLPEDSCPLPGIRKAFPGLIAGRSVHSLGAAVEAEKSGAGYLLFGPVFATPSKERFGPPKGLDELAEVCRAVSIPVYAVGGITPERSLACIEQGAWGIAALGPFLDVEALPSTIETYRAYLPT